MAIPPQHVVNAVAKIIDPTDRIGGYEEKAKEVLGARAWTADMRAQFGWTNACYEAILRGDLVLPRPWGESNRVASEGWRQRIVDSCCAQYDLPTIPVELIDIEPWELDQFASYVNQPEPHVVIAASSKPIVLLHETTHYAYDTALKRQGMSEEWQRYMCGHDGDFNLIMADLMAREIGPDVARDYIRELQRFGGNATCKYHALDTLTGQDRDTSQAA